MNESEGSAGDRDPYIYGRHPVLEALRAGQPLARLYVQDTLAARMPLSGLAARAASLGVPVHRVPRRRLDEWTAGAVHQGVVAVVAAVGLHPEEELERLVRSGPDPLVLVLDGVQDPHNLGAVARIADVVGAVAVVIPKHGSAPLSAVAMKASAGALAWVPVVAATNLSRTLEDLKAWGLFIWAAVPDGQVLYTEVDWRGGVALVVGGEGRGIRPLVVRHADGTVRLPMRGRVGSLNVAAATAVLAYEVLRQRS